MAPRKKKAVQKKRKAEVEAVVESALQTKRLRETASDALFKIDTSGSTTKRKKVIAEEDKGSKSLVEEKKIERVIKNKLGSSVPNKKEDKPGLYDPWSDEAKAPKTRRVLHKPAVESKARLSVKTAGTESYNPTLEDYQAGIEAVVSKQQALEALRDIKTTITLLSNHLISDEDHELAQSDAEDNNEDEEMEGEQSGAQTTSRRKDGKLTRAQRNKQARGQLAAKEAKENAVKKQIIRDIANAKAISKSITKAINEAATRNKEKSEKSEKGKKEALDLRDRRVAQVLLPAELSESLRTLKVAGGLLRDHLVHFQKVGVDMGNPNKRRRKPRGRKKVVDHSSGFPAHMKKWKSIYKV